MGTRLEAKLHDEPPECILDSQMSPPRFHPIRQVTGNDIVTFLLDCAPGLASGVTISAVTGTVSGIALGAVCQGGITAPSLTILGTNTTSDIDGRTIYASRALILQVNTTSAKAGRRVEITITFSCSNGDVRTVKFQVDIEG